jgi:predicted AAA+ superfamily ATPase
MASVYALTTIEALSVGRDSHGRINHSRVRLLVTVIQGVRRCGKSTLLRQLMANHGVSEDGAVFINFEAPRLVNDLDYPLLDHIDRLSTAGGGKALTFFLDEIQQFPHANNPIYVTPDSFGALIGMDL